MPPPAVTRFGTRRSSRRPVRPGVLRGLLPQAEDRLCPILRHPPHPGRHGGGAADLSGVLLPLVRPGAAGAGHCPGHHREATCRWCWIPRRRWRERIGRPRLGTEARAGGYILCYCISRPDALAPYIRRLAEETGPPVVQPWAYARRSTPRPARFSAPVRRSFWPVPGCRLCVHQLLPRNGVLRPVPKALLYGGGTGRDGCAGEFPDLQPVEPPGTGGSGSSAREIPRT